MTAPESAEARRFPILVSGRAPTPGRSYNFTLDSYILSTIIGMSFIYIDMESI